MTNMTNMTNNQVNTVVNNNMFRYIILEDEINYDNDDYGVWGAVLYDTIEKKICTTTYGHGTGMKERSNSIELCNVSLDIKQSLIEEMISLMVDKTPVASDSILENIARCSSEDNPTAIPVNVVRGRKFKGAGYLIYSISTSLSFGFGTFTKTFTKPAILDPTTGMIHIINSFEYIEYDDEFRNNFKNLVVKGLKMNEATVYSLAHLWAYEMSYSHCDKINYNSKVESLGKIGAKYINIPEIVKLSINANIAKRELENAIAREALKKEKMPAIIEWVKNNTDKKTDEDIKNLAEHIFNKKY